MEYTAADRDQIAAELGLLDRNTEQFHPGYFQRAPPCAPRLPLHRPLQVADLHHVDWTTFAPEVPQCEHPDDGPEDEWYECGCRHCQVHATPRTVCQLLLALIHTRNFYTRLCRLPVLTCLYDYFDTEAVPPAQFAAERKPAQEHVLQHRRSWQGAFTEYRDELPFAEPQTGHELVCDWKLQPGDETFLAEAVGDSWLYFQRDVEAHITEGMERPDELHEEFCSWNSNGGWFLPLPRFLREWRQLHPRGYRRWRRLLLDSFDLLIVRLLTHPDTCSSGQLATCVMEEMAVGLAMFHLDHTCETPHAVDLMGDHAAGQALLASLPVCMWDRDLSADPGWTLLERVLQDVDFFFLWPWQPDCVGLWPAHHGQRSQDVHPELLGPDVGRMRFPLDFLAPFGGEPARLQQLPSIPRLHLAALRIHRFWRDVCSDLQYAHARRCIAYAMESEELTVLGKRMRE
jgi:hypothetical protein